MSRFSRPKFIDWHGRIDTSTTPIEKAYFSSFLSILSLILFPIFYIRSQPIIGLGTLCLISIFNSFRKSNRKMSLPYPRGYNLTVVCWITKKAKSHHDKSEEEKLLAKEACVSHQIKGWSISHSPVHKNTASRSPSELAKGKSIPSLQLTGDQTEKNRNQGESKPIMVG